MSISWSVGWLVGRSVGGVTHSFDDPHVAPIGLLGLDLFRNGISSSLWRALVSKPFEVKIPDTAQMKDLLKSFQTITDFNQFLLD